LALDNNIKTPITDLKAGNIIRISNLKVVAIYKALSAFCVPGINYGT
jgi:hypothetical protein